MNRSVTTFAATVMALTLGFQAEVISNIDFPITPEWARTNYGVYDNCMNECLGQPGADFIQCDIDCIESDRNPPPPTGSGGSGGGSGSGGEGE
ncbi:MAG: hypothetical protein K0U98_26910 [Deltaproteobacteria bacterium]|nr:hypothetical protein [Deltaproteobacteria bacterium]